MNIYRRKILWKLALLLFAVMIGAGSLIYTGNLVENIKREEKDKAEMWALATQKLIEAEPGAEDLDYLFSVIEKNNSVPVILTDEYFEIVSFRNLNPARSSDTLYLMETLRKMEARAEPIVIDLGDDHKNYIFYRDSIILTRLLYYPYIQLGVIMLFVALSYLGFSSARRVEQNQVWVGMSKETAHQLGTPVSALTGWTELLRLRHPDLKEVDEIEKDVARIGKITHRFSRIGSKPALEPTDVTAVINQSILYMAGRTSASIRFDTRGIPDHPILAPLNASLFEWVMENLLKNSIDAINNDGTIAVTVTEETKDGVIIDVSDSGKGMAKRLHKRIFKPGFTTKATGWGLGLSLANRIVSDYHSGKIFVKSSEPDKGTTIRIVLKSV